MKINFQKIFIVISVIAVMSCFAVSVSADTTSDRNGGITSGGGGNGGQRTSYGQGTELFIEAVIDFSKGDITYDQFTSRTSEIVGDYMTEYTDRAGLAFMSEISGKISETVAKYGLDAPAYVAEWIYDLLDDYAETEEVSTIDKKGYKTMIHCKRIGYDGQLTGSEFYYYSDGYIVVYPQDDGTTKYTHYYSGYNFYTIQYNTSGKVTLETTGVGKSNASYTTDRYIVYVYGDVRYADGSEAPTDDETSTITRINLDELDDVALEELLEDILEELERQNPDLSTIEGLLEAIYYRLGTLDSDNDNALLSQVLVAIQSLEMNNDNSELVDILNDIKDSLTDGKDNTENENEDLTDELEKYLTVGDFVIDEDMYRNHSEILKLRLQEKFIFAEQLKELVTYTVNSYASSSENPQLNLSYNNSTYSMDFSAFDEHIPIIRFIIAAFTYITFAFRTYKKIPSYINGGDNL